MCLHRWIYVCIRQLQSQAWLNISFRRTAILITNNNWEQFKALLKVLKKKNLKVCVCEHSSLQNEAELWAGMEGSFKTGLRAPGCWFLGEIAALTALLLSSPTLGEGKPGPEYPEGVAQDLLTALHLYFFLLRTGGDIQSRKVPRDLSWLILWKMSREARWLLQGSFSADWVSESKVPIKGSSRFPWGCVCDHVISRVGRPRTAPELKSGNCCCF